jgi:hypothetical protein
MSKIEALPMPNILIRASAAIGKVDLHGRRGVTMLSVDETEAMALLLATLGLAPTKPGEAPPSDFFPHLKDR